MSLTPPISADDVIAFWREAGPKKWFKKDVGFDEVIRSRFEPLHQAASRGELVDWARTPIGALALVILLDQFPRNLYRGSAHAFATDALARSVAGHAVDAGFDLEVDASLRPFFYMPFEHSERMEDQDRSVALFRAIKDETGEEGFLPWAVAHRDIVARFDRFPHRNTCLGRRTTPEEQAFLDEGGFSG